MEKIYILLAILLLFTACDDGIVVSDPDPQMEIDSSKLIFLWEKTFENEEYYTKDIYYKDGSLYCAVGKALTKDWHLMKIDTSTGETLKRLATPNSSNLTVVKDILHIHDDNYHATFDLELNKLTELEYDEFENRMSYKDDIIFRHASNGNDSYSRILMNDYKVSKPWRVVQEQFEEGVFNAHLEVPAMEVNSQGDTIIYSYSRNYGFIDNTQYVDKVNFYARNITKQEFLWELPDMDPYGNAVVNNPPIITEERIYFVGHVSVFCINKENGDIIWQKDFVSGEGFSGCNYLLENNILYTRGSTGTLRYMDADTGEVLFSLNEGPLCDVIYADEDYVMYNSFDFLIRDPFSGEIICKDEDYPCIDRFAFDKESKRIYVSGFGSLFCFEIPH